MFPDCGEPAMFMLFDDMLFMDEPAIVIELDSIVPDCAMLFMVLVVILVICGWLVVIMESDIMFCGGSAWIASGSANARDVNDSLSLIIFFIGFIFLLSVNFVNYRNEMLFYFCAGWFVDKVVGSGSQPPVACNGSSSPRRVTHTARPSRPVMSFG